jgi:hypothetical protein
MKMCQTHWDAMRKAVDDRGMSDRIAPNGEEACKRIVEEVEGTAGPVTFDPLSSMNYAIWAEVLRVGGLYLMGAKPDGQEYCPLCEVEEGAGEGSAQNWINGAADEAKAYLDEHSKL